MITQYFDMLKDVGSSNGNSTIFLNHSPGSIGDMAGEVHQRNPDITIQNTITLF